MNIPKLMLNMANYYFASGTPIMICGLMMLIWSHEWGLKTFGSGVLLCATGCLLGCMFEGLDE